MAEDQFWPSTTAGFIQALRRGEPSACWDEFVQLYGPIVYRFCRRRKLNDQEANDVTQEVFIRVFRAIERFEYDPAKGRFGGWIGKITRREISRYIERHRTQFLDLERLNPSDVLADNVESDWENFEREALLQLALARVQNEVSEEHWRMFTTSWLDGRKPGQVAQELGVSAARVYKARFIVLERLKVIMHELLDDPA